MCMNLLSRGFSRDLLVTMRGQADAPRRRAVSLLTVPLFHVTGAHSFLYPALAQGSTLVMMRRWNAEVALRLIEQERITNVGGVPTIAMQLLDSPSFATTDLSSVVAITYGGAPAPEGLPGRIAAALPGVTPGNGYGMTETSSVVSFNVGADYLERPGSTGRLLPIMDARIVGEDGRPAPPDTPGELWLRGSNVALGYWRRSGDAAAAFSADGWLRTGDIATIDDERFIYIVDRQKDLIIRGGENIASVEIESVLHDHAAVLDAAVVGVPHAQLGEEVGAVVQVRDPASVSAEQLQAYVRSRLAGFKVPSHIRISTQPLPRNPQGKVLKAEVRKALIASPD
jgi:long-chain acyl-CoA synthetase